MKLRALLSLFAAFGISLALFVATDEVRSFTPAQTKASGNATVLSSIDELIKFSSAHTGLPVRVCVRGHLIDRDGLRQRVQARMRMEGVEERLRRSSVVLKKLGLLPRDFDYPGYFLSARLSSSLAGFYDPVTCQFYILDSVPPHERESMMAHELTHALQDQYLGLEKWMNPGAGEDDATGIGERLLARRALSEGQAMAVMYDYALAPYSQKLTDLPGIDQFLAQTPVAPAKGSSPSEAPPYVRESSIFPYIYGLQFVAAVLKQQGNHRDFGAALKDPPLNTHQVMHPGAYLNGENLAPLKLPPLESVLGSGFEKLDSGTLGEFDVLMFAKQFGSAEKASQIAAAWRGGYYFVARSTRGSNTGAAATPPSSNARSAFRAGEVDLFYLSSWDTPDAATRFASLYAASIPRRYPRATPVVKSTESARQFPPSFHNLQWDTSEGPVSIEARGTLVLALEGFDTPTASKLRAISIPSP